MVPSCERARDRAGDSDKAHLPEAHLPGPAGEDDERQPDDREDADRPGQLDPVFRQEYADAYNRREHERREARVRAPHRRLTAQLGRHALHFARRLPCRRRRAREPAEGVGPLHEQRDADDRGADRDAHDVDVVVVEHRRLVDDAEADRGEYHRGHSLHAADDGRTERGQQHGRIERAAENLATHTDPQEHGDEREYGGERPHDALQPSHRDAEERRAVGVLGTRPQRDADRTQAEERREGDEHQRHDDHHEHVVAVEDDELSDVKVHVEERRVGVDVAAATEPLRQQDRERRQQVDEQNRHDRENQSRRVEERPEKAELNDDP